jgi:hypothetical protein
MGETAITLTAYGKHRGCSTAAVSKAIRTKRLVRSVVVIEGHPKIADVALADEEWAAKSDRTRRPDYAHSGPSGDGSDAQQAPLEGAGVSFFEAQRLDKIESARRRKLENDEREGHLVDRNVVAKEAFEAERIVREALLNLPARLSGELAAETDAGRVHMRMDAAIREALNAAADTLLATVNA